MISQIFIFKILYLIREVCLLPVYEFNMLSLQITSYLLAHILFDQTHNSQYI